MHEIVENPSIGTLDLLEIVRQYPTRPLTNLSYAVDFALGGLHPFMFHATSIGLHIVNVVLLFVLARGLIRDGETTPSLPRRAVTLTAFAAASLFAVHPAMTQAVGYISGRAEVLAATLSLASLLCFRAGAFGGRPLALAGGIAFFVLGLGAKETAIMVPPLLIAYDWLFVRRSGSPRWTALAKVYVPLLLAALVFGGLRAWRYVGLEQAEHAGVQWTNVLLEIHVVQRYVLLLLLPLWQSVVPAVGALESLFDIRLLSAAMVIGLMIEIGVSSRRQAPAILLGVVWFFLMLLPSAALVVIADRGDPMAEHRVYLASCGFFMACASGAALWVRSHPPRARIRLIGMVGLLALALPAFGVLTIARNRVWSDPVLLWEDAARKAPGTWLAQYGVADAYRARGDCESAASAYRRAIALRPQDSVAYLGLAECLSGASRREAARDVLRDAMTQAPEDFRAPLALAALEERAFHRPEEALRLCRQVLARSPGLEEARDCVRRLGTPAR